MGQEMKTAKIEIRRLGEADVPKILDIIRDSREEYGIGRRVKVVLEPSDRALMETYRREYSAYFIAVANAGVIGGAGIAPLSEAEAGTCELQRMYLHREYRSRGIGKMLLDRCLRSAKDFGYRYCYAETVSQMTNAIGLYRSRGFEELPSAIGSTGHIHNDYWMILDLQEVRPLS